MRDRVGVFDSGLGGLSVAAEVLRTLPCESVTYFADSDHLPYGERAVEDIRDFALKITEFLILRGAKVVVMACNMSSAVALVDAREKYPHTPILGMINPGARAAVQVSDTGPIGVLATTGTVKSEAYVRAIHRLDSSKKVVQQACPKFVPLVESGRADSEEAEAAACTYVSPLVQAGCRTLILGCTHYPFLRRAIRAAAGSEVRIVDPAQETVRSLHNTLLEQRAVADTPHPEHRFYSSGNPQAFAELGSLLLGRPIERVDRVQWGVDLEAADGEADGRARTHIIDIPGEISR